MLFTPRRSVAFSRTCHEPDGDAGNEPGRGQRPQSADTQACLRDRFGRGGIDQGQRHQCKRDEDGGEGELLVSGDIEQIDNVYVDETSNGLTYAVEKFKEHALGGHVTFSKGERSAIATLAAKIL